MAVIFNKKGYQEIKFILFFYFPIARVMNFNFLVVPSRHIFQGSVF